MQDWDNTIKPTILVNPTWEITGQLYIPKKKKMDVSIMDEILFIKLKEKDRRIQDNCSIMLPVYYQ